MAWCSSTDRRVDSIPANLESASHTNCKKRKCFYFCKFAGFLDAFSDSDHLTIPIEIAIITANGPFQKTYFFANNKFQMLEKKFSHRIDNSDQI